MGPVVAAQLLIGWSDPGRVRSEAAFASLGEVAPWKPAAANGPDTDSTAAETGGSPKHVWINPYSFHGRTYLRVWFHTDFTPADGRKDYTTGAWMMK